MGCVVTAALDLLVALDAIVHADDRPSALSGRITICVRTPDRDVFWSAQLDDRAAGGFRTAVPAETDVILVLDEAEAEALLTGQALSGDPERCVIGGDRRLLERFFSRYCAFSSWLDVRAGRPS